MKEKRENEKEKVLRKVFSSPPKRSKR